MTRLANQVGKLAYESAAPAAEGRRAAIKLAAALCACRAQVAKLEAENSGQREALLALNRHVSLARDFEAIRIAERTACAALVHSLGLTEAAKRIQERE